MQVTWNYTTYLNIAFLVLAAVLVLRFFRSAGRQMLAMMGGGPDDMATHGAPGIPGAKTGRAPSAGQYRRSGPTTHGFR